MIARRKLHHTAAGLLGNFISRNNDYQGYWALGVLYTEARAAGMRVELDLLHGQALPETLACVTVARGYAAFLRTAFTRQGATPDMLSSARLSLAFGLPAVKMSASDGRFGDAVDSTLTITSRDGKTVTRYASARCAPHDSQVYRRAMAMREAGWRLHRHLTERGRECEGRSSLDVLREAYPDARPLAFDLLRECAVPPHPAGDAVARGYAGCLRQLLGEWMDDLDTAGIRLRFSTFPGLPGASVFAENWLVARDGYATWHNGVARIVPEAPKKAP